MEFSSNKPNSRSDLVIISKELSLTQLELSNAINNTAAKYFNQGIKPGDKVVILSENSAAFVVAVFALWRINAIPVPLNVRFTKRELNDIIESANIKFVLNCDKYSFESKSVKQIKLEIENSENILSYESISNKDDIAVLLFTSGSSGTSKGVELTNQNLYSSYLNISSEYSFMSSDSFLASLPFYHIGGFSILSRSILSGGTLIIPDSLSVASITTSLDENNPTIVSLVPTMLKRLIQNGVNPNSKLRLAFIGGGPSSDSLVSESLNLGWPFVKVYGSTETCSMVCGIKNKELKQRSASGGRAFSNIELKIFNEDHQGVKSGTIGEIGVKSKSIARGYLNQHELWNSKFYDGFYLTGDFGYLDNEGYLFVVSRRTDLIVSGGENIDPSEIEKNLLSFQSIKETVIFPVFDNEWGQIPVAVIIFESGMEMKEKEIIIKLKENLSSFKIPKKFFFLNDLPRNELGKVDLRKLKTQLNLD